MITAVDTSVILDILSASPKYCERSLRMYQHCLSQGKMAVCPVVWAEVRPFFHSDLEIQEVMDKLHLIYDEFSKESANLTGTYWQSYRTKGGRRKHMIPDFLVGAHAVIKADQLLTRDRGFYREYFKELKVVDPA